MIKMRSLKEFLGQTKIALVLMIFLPLVMIIISMNQAYTSIVEQEFREYKKNYYEDEAYKLSYIISSNIRESIVDNKDFFQKIADKYSMKIEILDDQKDHTIYKTFDNEIDLDLHYAIEVPILLDGNVTGHLKTYYNIEDSQYSPAISSFKRNMENKNNIIIMSAFLCALLLSFLIAHFASSPIKKVSDIAVRLIQGERGLDVPRKGTVEIKNLVDSLNTILIEFQNMENWRQQMLQDMTHELRTPVTSILTTLEAMIDGVYPKNKEYLMEIYGEVDRLSRLIINVQNLSEAEGARFALNIEEVNLVEIVKSTIEGFQFIANKKRIKMEFKYQKRPHYVHVDPDRFIQVITNIISNALKYTPEHGNIEIGLDLDEQDFLFYCLDSGIGLSKKEQSLVFNRFYRVTNSTIDETNGSGIGLNISKALVQAHGGKIGVESKKGEGSLFWVKMPINQEKNLND